jgi:hypothetical protein
LTPSVTRTPTITQTPTITPSPSETVTVTSTPTAGSYAIFLPLILQGYPPTPTATPTPRPNEVHSGWASVPPVIDGVISAGEWGNAGVIATSWGRVYVMNDAQKLYVGYDLTGDTQDNPSNTQYVYFLLDVATRGTLERGSDPELVWSEGNETSLGVAPYDRMIIVPVPGYPRACLHQDLQLMTNRAANTFVGHRVIEFWAYLTEGQTSTGDSAGLRVLATELDSGSGVWPAGTDGCEPQTWGTLLLAAGP